MTPSEVRNLGLPHSAELVGVVSQQWENRASAYSSSQAVCCFTFSTRSNGNGMHCHYKYFTRNMSDCGAIIMFIRKHHCSYTLGAWGKAHYGSQYGWRHTPCISRQGVIRVGAARSGPASTLLPLCVLAGRVKDLQVHPKVDMPCGDGQSGKIHSAAFGVHPKVDMPCGDGQSGKIHSAAFGKHTPAFHAPTLAALVGLLHARITRGEGFCVCNDISSGAAVAMRDYGLSRIVVVDLDVHQGNGTSSIWEGDRRVVTFDMHGANNYPYSSRMRSTYDIAMVSR
eukprot:1159861-Pelagomonas_calceolata.AAC.4